MARAWELVEAATAAFPEHLPPPFDPLLYARHLGIRVKQRAARAPWDALFIPFGAQPQIVCNTRIRSPERRRFSVAHEIAHTFFANARDTYQMRTRHRHWSRSGPGAVLERLVDAGAAELLMPRPWFDRELNRLGVRASAIPTLATVFEVSRSATARRVVETSARPCAVGFFVFDRRPSGRGSVAYRVREAYANPGFPYLLPTGRSMPSSSVVHRCSLGTTELEAVEELTLGRRSTRVRVSAFPLHRRPGVVGDPPTVCAVLQAVEEG
jgi:Zn-dependent peptidase ImmA (M78 family)